MEGLLGRAEGGGTASRGNTWSFQNAQFRVVLGGTHVRMMNPLVCVRCTGIRGVGNNYMRVIHHFLIRALRRSCPAWAAIPCH